MDKMTDTQQLGDLLNQQGEQAKALNTLLEREKDVLLNRDAKEMQALAEEKNRLISNLAGLGQAQNTLLERNGFSRNKQGLEQFIEAASPKARQILARLHQQTVKELSKAQRLNQVNGVIIAANRQSAETALAILRGQFGGNNILYGATGEQINTEPPNTLAKA